MKYFIWHHYSHLLGSLYHNLFNSTNIVTGATTLVMEIAKLLGGNQDVATSGPQVWSWLVKLQSSTEDVDIDLMERAFKYLIRNEKRLCLKPLDLEKLLSNVLNKMNGTVDIVNP